MEDNFNSLLNKARDVEASGVFVQYEELNLKGNWQWMLCPYHQEKSPSCRIQNHHAHCFSCEAHFDSIKYLQDIQNMTFYEALESITGEKVVNNGWQNNRPLESVKIPSFEEALKMSEEKFPILFHVLVTEHGLRNKEDIISYLSQYEFENLRTSQVGGSHTITTQCNQFLKIIQKSK